MSSYYHFAMPVPEVIVPSKFHSPPVDNMMSSAGSGSSSKDTKAISSAMMSPCSVLPMFWVLPWVDLVDLLFEDKGGDLEEDKSIKEDLSMDEKDPITELELMKKDTSQDFSKGVLLGDLFSSNYTSYFRVQLT